MEAEAGTWIEHDHVVAAPTPAAPCARVAQHDRFAAVDLDFLQLATCEEPDEPAVRRPEWKRPTLGSRNRPHDCGGNRSEPNLVRGRAAGDKHDVPAIRRHGQLCGSASTSTHRTAKKGRVLRRGDRELHRRGGHSLAAAAQRDDRRGDQQNGGQGGDHPPDTVRSGWRCHRGCHWVVARSGCHPCEVVQQVARALIPVV